MSCLARTDGVQGWCMTTKGLGQMRVEEINLIQLFVHKVSLSELPCQIFIFLGQSLRILALHAPCISCLLS